MEALFNANNLAYLIGGGKIIKSAYDTYQNSKNANKQSSGIRDYLPTALGGNDPKKEEQGLSKSTIISQVLDSLSQAQGLRNDVNMSNARGKILDKLNSLFDVNEGQRANQLYEAVSPKVGGASVDGATESADNSLKLQLAQILQNEGRSNANIGAMLLQLLDSQSNQPQQPQQPQQQATQLQR